VIVETVDFYQTAEVNTRTGEIESDPQRDVLYKPPADPAVEAAKQTPLGKVYLDWGHVGRRARCGQEPIQEWNPPQLPPNRSWTTVESPTCASTIPISALPEPQAATRSALRLHRRRSRRCRRINGTGGAQH